jgi:hypothetical protein
MWAVGTALSLRAGSSWASSVDVRCPELPATESGELQARARLLLSSAGLESARVAVECDVSGAWLVWTDGSRSTIEAHSGIVEGALDAIEGRLSAARSERSSSAGSGPSAPAELIPPGMDNPDAVSGGARASTADAAGTKSPPDKKTEPVAAAVRMPLEGGIAVGTTTELWSGNLGVGLRVDVGVGFGDRLAVVIGQAARIGLSAPSDGQLSLYDLQAGFAFGAPYRQRNGFGLILLGGAERLSVSDTPIFGSSGFWLWAATATLGARMSIPAGSVDVWAGIDAELRSKSLEVRGTSPQSIPDLSGSFSLGCFFPAFTRETTAHFGSRQVGATR